MSHPPLSTSQRTSRLVVTVVVAAVLIAITTLHLTAILAARRSTAAGRFTARVAAAQLAARIEPWNASYRERARVMSLWTQGEALLAAGDYNAAVDTLRLAYVAEVGNSELLALFKRAQAAQALATNKKAHLQHAHEGPGGTLRPEDVER